MSFDADEDILQDFLVEAGEILEELSEQLVDLENRIDDKDLLNCIFRGFHTVKGGAGFLQLDALVEVCHIAENAFDCLRNDKLKVDADLMDVVLQALDSVNDMFSQVHERVLPTPADPKLLQNLQKFVDIANGDFHENDELDYSGVSQESISKGEEVPTSESCNTTPISDKNNDDITDEEFESLLDELHGPGNKISAESSVTSDSEKESCKIDNIINSQDKNISDEEFEALLDALHGTEKNSHKASNVNQPDHPKEKDPIKTARVTGLSDDKKYEVDQPTIKSKTAIPSKIKKPEDKSNSDATKAQNNPRENSATKTETTVRVDTKRLDDIMNMVGELVLVRNRLVRLGVKSTDEAISKAVSNLDVVTADLQSSVMKTRMQPIKKVFGRFPRVVRDLARSLNKEISLELIGEDTDLDKNLVEALADPLVHLVRNSVDHGIEKPDVREKNGKLKTGKIILSAQQEGDHIVLSISDDGGGMDADILRYKAVEKGVLDQESADRLTDHDAFNLIFHPGFSTKEKISDVSGRGVGMDVVKTKITQLNGTISVDSQLGKGTVIAIKVPLTLAIMPTLMVMLGEQTFALPLVNVNEIFNLNLNDTNVVDGQEVIVVRSKSLPLFHLKRWLVKDQRDVSYSAHVVVVTVGTQKVGFVVDQLIGQEEVVIKPLGKMLQGTDGMAGATITGDGRIALIIDVPSMLRRYVEKI